MIADHFDDWRWDSWIEHFSLKITTDHLTFHICSDAVTLSKIHKDLLECADEVNVSIGTVFVCFMWCWANDEKVAVQTPVPASISIPCMIRLPQSTNIICCPNEVVWFVDLHDALLNVWYRWCKTWEISTHWTRGNGIFKNWINYLEWNMVSHWSNRFQIILYSVFE